MPVSSISLPASEHARAWAHFTADTQECVATALAVSHALAQRPLPQTTFLMAARMPFMAVLSEAQRRLGESRVAPDGSDEDTRAHFLSRASVIDRLWGRLGEARELLERAPPLEPTDLSPHFRGFNVGEVMINGVMYDVAFCDEALRNTFLLSLVNRETRSVTWSLQLYGAQGSGLALRTGNVRIDAMKGFKDVPRDRIDDAAPAARMLIQLALEVMRLTDPDLKGRGVILVPGNCDSAPLTGLLEREYGFRIDATSEKPQLVLGGNNNPILAIAAGGKTWGTHLEKPILFR